VEDRARTGEILASKYRLDEELGRGGMGAVYRAFHLGVHKQFAIKVLNAEVAGKKSIAARLVLEAQAAGRIGHSGILEVYDVGEDDDGRPFLVMELLRGETLASLIARGPVDVDVACWIAAQVLDVLDAAHRAGVVHRDVKPQNVFLVAPSAEAGAGPRTVKLLDFGIAKFHLDDATGITRSGEVMGSPLYMAPEQARGEVEVDARVDVWSVGAMLFEMLTGKPAHLGPSVIAVLAKILTETAPVPSSKRPSVPREIDAVVQRALVIERDDRYASSREMLDALAEARAKCGWTDTAPSFEAVPPRATVAVPPAREQTPVSARRVAKGDRVSKEPAMESAVTAGTMTTPRSRLVGIVIAATTLVLGALLPWLVWGWGLGHGETAAGARPTPSAIANAESDADTTAKNALASAASVTTTTDAGAPGSLDDAAVVGAASASAVSASAVSASAVSASAVSASAVSASAVSASAVSASAVSASATRVSPVTSVARAPRGAVSAADSKPSCEAGEVLSFGHCCPRGHIWQSGRCERPLATSF
jgi:tRNA A-37 threonylcarbamoyl transferase component Bud32